MKASVVAGSLLSGLVLVAFPLQAQQVSADVVVYGGPVAGRVVVGHGYSTYDHPPVVYRRPPVRRVVVVERPVARLVVVDRLHRHRSAQFWRRHGYRPVTLYYLDGRYYDRPIRRAYVREVVVWERDGRFYDECEDHGHDRDHDRHWDD
jgi:hypothetical protein